MPCIRSYPIPLQTASHLQLYDSFASDTQTTHFSKLLLFTDFSETELFILFQKFLNKRTDMNQRYTALRFFLHGQQHANTCGGNIRKPFAIHNRPFNICCSFFFLPLIWDISRFLLIFPPKLTFSNECRSKICIFAKKAVPLQAIFTIRDLYV